MSKKRRKKNAPNGTQHDLEIPKPNAGFFFVNALTSSIMFVFETFFSSRLDSAEKKRAARKRIEAWLTGAA